MLYELTPKTSGSDKGTIMYSHIQEASAENKERSMGDLKMNLLGPVDIRKI